MQLMVLGLNHNSAPVKIRESLAIKADQYEGIYKQLLAHDEINEAVLLCTCNRVEFYIVTDGDIDEKCDIIKVLVSVLNIDEQLLNKHTYFIKGLEAVTHIFSVASGLDSLVLGEPQILGQMKASFKIAKENHSISSFLSHVTEFTLKTAKKVRTYTGVSDNPVSVSYAAVELAKKIFDDLSLAKVLIIGAGEMCVLALKHLVTSGVTDITVTNRTYEKAVKLADDFNGAALKFETFKAHLESYDIVISSTGSDSLVVMREDIIAAMERRKYKPIFFIDIAVPRDIDPKASDIENIYIYDMDDLKNVVEANKKSREKEAKKALEIISQSTKQFEECMQILKVNPAIKELKNIFETNKNIELKKYIEKYKITDADRIEKVDYLLTLTMNKILHRPFKNLKDHAKDDEKYTLAEAVEIIFGENEKCKSKKI